MKIKATEVQKKNKTPAKTGANSPSLLQKLLRCFDPEHRYRMTVQRFLHLELDVIHRERHYTGRNLTVIQVKLLADSTHEHRTEYVIARSKKGNWVEVQIANDRGARRILTVNTLQEADVRLELLDAPEIYQQHFGSIEDI